MIWKKNCYIRVKTKRKWHGERNKSQIYIELVYFCYFKCSYCFQCFPSWSKPQESSLSVENSIKTYMWYFYIFSLVFSLFYNTLSISNRILIFSGFMFLYLLLLSYIRSLVFLVVTSVSYLANATFQEIRLLVHRAKMFLLLETCIYVNQNIYLL